MEQPYCEWDIGGISATFVLYVHLTIYKLKLVVYVCHYK